jgi:uncharacterized protein YtpQ (UPF0354 family)
MHRLIRRLFGGSAGGSLDPGPFQAFVLDLLERRFPGESWAVTEDPAVIRCGTDWRFGLQSLYAEYRRENLGGNELEEAIIAHFARTLRNARTKPEDPQWPGVQTSLRLQLVPTEYGEQAPILTFPFHSAVVIAIVIDLPEGYAVVRSEDVERWGVRPDELYGRAAENLNAGSAAVQAQLIQGPNRCIGVQEMDGYDAARLLVPQFRQFLADQLSMPFFAAIPNRDFLMAWAADCEPGFHQFAREKAAKDFGERPYPLTSEVFRAERDGVRPWAF